MAIIGNAFDAARAQRSSEYAYSCWYNYKYENNTLNISDEDMQAIQEKWNKNIAHWISVASQDNTEYKLDDDEWDISYQEGWDDAADKSGHNGDTTKNKISNAANSTLAAGSGVLSATVSIATDVAIKTATKAAEKAAETVIKKSGEYFAAQTAEMVAKSAATQAAKIAAEEGVKTSVREGLGLASGRAIEATIAQNAADKAAKVASEKSTELVTARAAEHTTSETAKKATKFAGWMITAPLSLAAGILYTTTKPNKKEHDALEELAQQIIEAQSTISGQEVTLEEKEAEITELSEQATKATEDSNQEIANKQEKFVKNMASYKILMARVASGESVSDSDKALLKGTARNLKTAGEEITSLSDKSQDEILVASDEIESKQGDYDSVAETLASIQGLTDLCESYDQATRTLCIVEAASQSLNVASGVQASIEAGIAAASSMGFNVYAIACVAMGVSGAAMSGVGAVEQSKFAIDLKDVVNTRTTAQNMLEHANGYYEGSIDKFATHLEDVNALETTKVSSDITNGNIPEVTIQQTVGKNEDDSGDKTTYGFGRLTSNNNNAVKNKNKNPFM